jgi:hypothetical protein
MITQKSSTERRYSDFVWLLDCLIRRYPFRLLPSLPPKAVQYQGHFIGQDEGFLERRKRGLERFLNSLVNHPVLSKDAILLKFLNEPNVRLYVNPYSKSQLNITHACVGLDVVSQEPFKRFISRRILNSNPLYISNQFPSSLSRIPLPVHSSSPRNSNRNVDQIEHHCR